MAEINLSSALPGMVLTESCTDLMGNPLLEPGTVLNVNHLRILKAWAVKTIAIEDDTSEPAQTTQPTGSESGKPSPKRRRPRKTTKLMLSAGGQKADREKSAPSVKPKDQDPFAELDYRFALCAGDELMDKIKEIAREQLSLLEGQ